MSINLEPTDNQYLQDKNDIDKLIKKDDSLIFRVLKEIYLHRKATGKNPKKQDKWKYLKNRYIDDINNNNTDIITDIIELYNANLRADQEQKQDKSHTTATRLLSKQMPPLSETVAITEAITRTKSVASIKTDTKNLQQLEEEFSQRLKKVKDETERLMEKEVNEFRRKFSQHPTDVEKLKTFMQTFDDSKQQVIVRFNDLLHEISHGEISTTDFFSTEVNNRTYYFATTHDDSENFTVFYNRIKNACQLLAKNDTLIENFTEDSFRSKLATLTTIKADLNVAAGIYFVVFSPIARQVYLCEEEKFLDIFTCGLELEIYLDIKQGCNIYVNKLTAVIKFIAIVPQHLIKMSETEKYVSPPQVAFPHSMNYLDLSVDVIGKASLTPDSYYEIIGNILNYCRKSFLNSKEYALDDTDIEEVQSYVSPKMLATGKFKANDVKIRFPINTVLKITDSIEPNPLDNDIKIVGSRKNTQAKKKPSHPLPPYYPIKFSVANDNNKLSIQLEKFILTNKAFSKILKSTTVRVSLGISSNIFRIAFQANTLVSKKIYKILLKSMISGCKELGIYELIEQKTLEALKNVAEKDINKIKDIPIQFSITKATAQDLVKIYSPVTTPVNSVPAENKPPRCPKSKKHRRKKRNKRR